MEDLKDKTAMQKTQIFNVIILDRSGSMQRIRQAAVDGFHLGGAAMIAKERFGAVWRQGFLNHPILGERLRAVTKALLTHTDMDVVDILGEVDASSINR